MEDLEKFRQEKAAFEETTKLLNDVHFGKTVKLNVGGKIFKTTLNTLRKDPDSMLSAMFSGRFELKPDEEDGAYFIDRNGELFGYVLNYLRNDELFCPNDKIFRRELLAEAMFYQVHGMITYLTGNSLKASIILKNENHRSVVMSWLPPGSTCSLLFRASTDGETNQDFHRCCDNNGPSLVVVKRKTFIFGAFTSKSWTSPDLLKIIPDSESFLFTLVNPSGSNPMKITCNPSVGGGIQCCHTWGPSFGYSYLSDFRIDIGGVCYSQFGNGFTCPEGVDNCKNFTGKSPCKVDEIEVFEVEF